MQYAQNVCDNDRCSLNTNPGCRISGLSSYSEDVSVHVLAQHH